MDTHNCDENLQAHSGLTETTPRDYAHGHRHAAAPSQRRRTTHDAADARHHRRTTQGSDEMQYIYSIWRPSGSTASRQASQFDFGTNLPRNQNPTKFTALASEDGAADIGKRWDPTHDAADARRRARLDSIAAGEE